MLESERDTKRKRRKNVRINVHAHFHFRNDFFLNIQRGIMDKLQQ